jgi:ATP-binding cassette, subfamily B, putative efflux pump
MQNLRLFYQYSAYLRPYIFPLTVAIISDLFAIILEMIPPLLTILIFDYAYPQKDLFLFTGVVAAGLAIYFVSFFFDSANNYNNVYIGQKIYYSLASKLFAKITRLPILSQMRYKTGDLIVRTLEDADLACGIVLNAFSALIINLVRLTVFIFIVISIDPLISLLALASIPFYLIETHFFSGRLEKLQENCQQMESTIHQELQEKLSNLKTIKAFSNEHRESKKINGFLLRRVKLNIKEEIISIISEFTNSITLQVWSVFIAWILGYQVIAGNVSVGQAVAMGLYLPLMQEPIQQLGDLYTSFKVGLVSTRRVDEIISLKDEINADPEEDNSIDFIKKGEICLENVSFQYSHKKNIISNMDLTIPPKSSLAIVGESGSGKSTIFNLLVRFYNPTQGMILIDGQNIVQVHLRPLRTQIGVVFQEISLFGGTISENIKYGRPCASHDEMLEAARQSGIHDFITSLPKAYDTELAHLGQNLSGGQRQRIAIARALLLNPKIIILDEATSALDAESEFIIQDTLHRCKEKKTVVFVAHRLHSVKAFDQIIVLDQGVIVEKGTFKELMDRKGTFFTLYNLQQGGLEEFLQRMDMELQRHYRYEQNFSLALFEIENSGKDASKIPAQDFAQIMKEIDLIVKKEIRVMDFSSVFAENKIVVGMPEVDEGGAQIFAERMAHILRKYHFENHGIKKTAGLKYGLTSVGKKKLIYSEKLFQLAKDDLIRRYDETP